MLRITFTIHPDGAPEVSDTRELTDGQSLTFGREPGPGGILLTAGQVSRAHFQVTAAGDALILKALQSTNGTMVDGTRVGAVSLISGQSR